MMSVRVLTQTCTLHSIVQLKVEPALLLDDRRRRVRCFVSGFDRWRLSVIKSEERHNDVPMFRSALQLPTLPIWWCSCRRDGVPRDQDWTGRWCGAFTVLVVRLSKRGWTRRQFEHNLGSVINRCHLRIVRTYLTWHSCLLMSAVGVRQVSASWTNGITHDVVWTVSS